MTPRLPGNDRRAQEVVKHLAATFEHVGRMLAALERDNWDSARDHLGLASERAAIANMCLNVGSPDSRQTLAAVRELLPKPWADALAAFLAGTEPRLAPLVQDSAEQSRTLPDVPVKDRTAPRDETEARDGNT